MRLIDRAVKYTENRASMIATNAHWRDSDLSSAPMQYPESCTQGQDQWCKECIPPRRMACFGDGARSISVFTFPNVGYRA